MSNKTKPAPCAICGTIPWSESMGYRCECGAWAAENDWNQAQRSIREERTWQLVVALAPAAFPDLRLGGDGDKGGIGVPCMKRRWRRVWEAARAGVEAPKEDS